MGTLLIPNSNYYFTGAKDGNLYLFNKDNMGGFNLSVNMVQQTIPINVSLHCQPSYYKGSKNEFVYVWSENDQLRALQFNRSNNRFETNEIIYPNYGGTGQSGAVLSVSSNGTKDGTGILWAAYAYSGDAESNVTVGILKAFDANDVTKELWDSYQNSSDAVGFYVKFSPPTVANGHVYLATFSNKVQVYGLK
jgi:hypothetical protein